MNGELKQKSIGSDGLYCWKARKCRIKSETGELCLLDIGIPGAREEIHRLAGATRVSPWHGKLASLLGCGFDLTWATGRMWSFLAPDAENCQQWVKTLQDCIETESQNIRGMGAGAQEDHILGTSPDNGGDQEHAGRKIAPNLMHGPDAQHNGLSPKSIKSPRAQILHDVVQHRKTPLAVRFNDSNLQELSNATSVLWDQVNHNASHVSAQHTGHFPSLSQSHIEETGDVSKWGESGLPELKAMESIDPSPFGNSRPIMPKQPPFNLKNMTDGDSRTQTSQQDAPPHPSQPHHLSTVNYENDLTKEDCAEHQEQTTATYMSPSKKYLAKRENRIDYEIRALQDDFQKYQNDGTFSDDSSQLQHTQPHQDNSFKSLKGGGMEKKDPPTKCDAAVSCQLDSDLEIELTVLQERCKLLESQLADSKRLGEARAKKIKSLEQKISESEQQNKALSHSFIEQKELYERQARIELLEIQSKIRKQESTATMAEMERLQAEAERSRQQQNGLVEQEVTWREHAENKYLEERGRRVQAERSLVDAQDEVQLLQKKYKEDSEALKERIRSLQEEVGATLRREGASWQEAADDLRRKHAADIARVTAEYEAKIERFVESAKQGEETRYITEKTQALALLEQEHANVRAKQKAGYEASLKEVAFKMSKEMEKREQHMAKDLKQLKELHEERVRRLEEMLTRESALLAEARQEQAKLHMEKASALAEIQRHAEESRKQAEEHLEELSFIKAHVNATLSREDQAKYMETAATEELRKLLEERRLERAEMLQMRQQLESLHTTAKLAEKAQREAERDVYQIRQELDICRHEVSMLEGEKKRLKRDIQNLEKRLLKLDNLVYGKGSKNMSHLPLTSRNVHHSKPSKHNKENSYL